jgi:hypothetical protein
VTPKLATVRASAAAPSSKFRCPTGRWGAVFTIDMTASKPALLLLAVGERHPARPWKLSVYEIAHRRLNR